MSVRPFCVCFFALAIAACVQFPAEQPQSSRFDDAVARRLLVTTRQDAGIARSVVGDPASYYVRRRGYGPTPDVNRALDRIAREYDIRRVTGWFISAIGEYCEVYELRPDQALDELMARIASDPSVELVQEMNVFMTEGVRYDDPYAAMQPALATLSIESAHEFATGRGVVVAVVDSSVDRRHLELRGRVQSWKNMFDEQKIRRAEVHGTAVAGIIGSTANNGEGIVGVAPGAQIASLRACQTVDVTTGRAECSSFSLAQAMETAIRLRADIINLSLSGPYDPLLARLIDEATEGGMIIVAALADESDGAHSFPASYRGVIAAESSEVSGAGSTAGNVLRAPGAEIMSTVPDDSYAFFTGNSMSAAYISGVSALIRERRSGIRADELFRLLLDTGDQKSINACRAVVAVDGGEGSCGDEN